MDSEVRFHVTRILSLSLFFIWEILGEKKGLVNGIDPSTRGPAPPWEHREAADDGYLRAVAAFLLIELDEVFDRKSIKRDGAARQLQSAEGSSAGGGRGSLHYSPGAVLRMERNPSSLCHHGHY